MDRRAVGVLPQTASKLGLTSPSILTNDLPSVRNHLSDSGEVHEPCEHRALTRRRTSRMHRTAYSRSTRVPEAKCMPDIVLIPFPGLGTLAMTRDQFNSALAAGREMGTPAAATPSQSAPSDELVDADCLEQRTGVPKSWWMAQARIGRIPFRKIGRRVRFDPKEVLNSSAFQRRSNSTGDRFGLD
jgi:hypothetical protein